MNIHVIALLDPPSAKSMGMVPFLERLPDGSGLVHGFDAAPGPSMTKAEIDSTIAEGAGRPVNLVAERPEGSLIAAWAGLELLQNAVDLGAPAPELPEDPHLVEKLGYVWIAEKSSVYAMLEAWTMETSRIAFQTRSLPLARLMIWVLPQHVESAAALWYTMPTPAMRTAEMRFQTKLRRDAGEVVTEIEMEARFIAVRDKYLGPGTLSP